MNLAEAHEYIDILLDKADQPYFIEEEKNKFLNLAISDFINMHYQKMTADEDSRRALSGCIRWQSFTLTAADIISGSYVPSGGGGPTLSMKYDDTTSTPTKGHFQGPNQYVVPKNHLYVLSLGVGYYNKDEVIDPSNGNIYSGVTANDIIFSPTVSAENKSTRDYYEHDYTQDPFNKPNEHSPHWSYIENRIIIDFKRLNIRYINMQVITLPTVAQAFSEAVYGASPSPASLTFAEHYQKQIIQMAVKRMTQTDVGLMTPPSN